MQDKGAYKLPFTMKGDKNMDYKTIRDKIEDMVNDNHKDFVKAVISMEKGINDESALDKLYDAYMANDTINLLHEDFDYMIEDLREQGQIKDLPYVQQEKDDLVNIVGNVVGNVDVIEIENKNGEGFKVANFSVVSKDDEGNFYDPLAKDLDNDSIIDRYDNDFRDSDYFESTYDVEDNLHTKEETSQRTEDKPSILGQIRAYQSESKTEEKQNTKEQQYAR